MATLPRPGVEISQEIVVQSPTVLTPSLVPCIIGPCFQMVNPIDEDGALNPQASVSIAARIQSTAALTEPVNLRGREFIISINNGDDQVISMPAAVNGNFAMSFALIQNTINKQLTGATAEFTPGVVDGVAQPSRLVFRTNAKGPTASITLRPHPNGDASSAYGAGGDDIIAMNDLQGTAFTGQTNYTNIAYNIPYTSLPSPMTSPEECVWQGDDIALYRFFANSLYELSDNSAVNWNAYTLADSGINGAATTNSLQGAVANGKTTLWGKPGTGSKTNRLCSTGVAASITIPLAHQFAAQFGVQSDTSWPDASGENYLKVTALGFQNYIGSGNPADLGNLIGADGNDVTVAFTDGGANSASWNAGTATLTIEINNASTFDDLAAALEEPAFADSISSDLIIEMGPGFAVNGGFPCRGITNGGPWTVGAASFNLHGGSDPVDFSRDAAGTERQAFVAGSTNITGAVTGGQLGLTGETLSVSVDGGIPLDIQIPAGGSIVTAIDTALDPVGASCQSVASANHLGEVVNHLQISTTSTNGHDSTLELSASSDLVLQRLFAGHKSATETVTQAVTATLTGVTDTNNAARRWGVMGGVGNDFNLLASTVGETALQVGSLSIQTSGLALGTIRTHCDNDAVVAAAAAAGWNDGLVLSVSLDSGNSFEDLALDCNSGGTMGAPIGTLAELVSDINAKIAVSMVIGGECVAHEANGTLCITRTKAAHAAGETIQLGGSGASNTDALLEGLLTNANPAVPFDVDGITADATITLTDGGNGNSILVTSISLTSLAGCCPINTPDTSNPSALTEYILGGSTDVGNAVGQASRGDNQSLLEWSEGHIGIVTAGQSDEAVLADVLPVTFAFTGASWAIISYSRVWRHAMGAEERSYSSRLYHGRSNQVMTADMLYSNGSVLGRVTGLEAWNIHPDPAHAVYAGSQIVISEFALSKLASLDKWYVTAQNLVSGTGDDTPTNIRPEPEAEFNDLTQMYSIKPGVNRNAAGIAVAGSSAPIYAQVKALRKDVTADTANPGLLVFGSIAEVDSLIGPIQPDNPLAFGLYMAFLNTTDITISGMGIGDVSADAPAGTLEGYAECLDFLQLHEVYAIAPMTHDGEVFKLLSLHVSSMSEPVNKSERMFLACPQLPSEEVSTLVASETFGLQDVGGGKYEITVMDENSTLNIPMAIDGKTNAGGSVLGGGNGSSYLPSDGIYLDREGDAFRYLVVGTPSGLSVTVETSDVFFPGEFGPDTSGNDDSYYRIGLPAVGNLSTWEADGELCSIKIRQPAIDMSGTAGKLKACETLAEIAGGVTGFQNRRMVMMQPEQVGTTVGGMEVLVPGYYLCAGVAGMIGQQNPSQPFTNLPMVGYTRPVGSSDFFSENQMATAAAGGIYWVIQDVPGGPCVSRHQLTTDVTSLKTRELSILKAIDFVAKLLRTQVKRYIGKNNITIQLLETISLSMQAALASVSGSVVAEASLDSLTQSETSPDEIVAEVGLIPFYPANRIKITIVI